MPQEEMRQHGRQHMMVPARIFPYLILVHPEFRFAFFKALFHGPADTTEPDKGAQGRAHRGITDIVRVCWLTLYRPVRRSSSCNIPIADGKDAEEILGSTA